MRKTPQGWKAWDVIVEGISYVKSLRDDFGAGFELERAQRDLDRIGPGRDAEAVLHTEVVGELLLEAANTLAESYRAIRYREELDETCTRLRATWPSDAEVSEICRGTRMVADTASARPIPESTSR